MEANHEPEDSCSFCDAISLDILMCRICGRFYCPLHASDTNPDSMCEECTDPLEYSVSEGPIIDSDGHVHKGLDIKPTGAGYRTTAAQISQMSQPELEEYIIKGQARIKMLETTKTKMQISMSMAQMEVAERSDKEQRSLRQGLKGMRTVAGVGHTVGGTKSTDVVKMLAAKLRKSGVTVELLQKLIKEQQGKGAN